MKKPELAEVLAKNQLVQPTSGQNIVPTFTGSPIHIKRIIEFSKKQKAEFHRQMGGDGTSTELLVFRTSTPPESTQLFRAVKGLIQAFFKPGTSIFIVYAD